MPTAAFTTLGCKVNQYETQRILDSFAAAGFAVVPFDSPADVYVVNSCSVTSAAETKSRATLRRAARLNPAAKVVVTGCAAQMAVNRGESLPEADVAVPNSEKLETIRWLFRAFPELEAWVRSEPAPQAPRPPGSRCRATLKIQDGCSVYCSYCSIPYTRPGMSSRHHREVLDEAARLAASGYREVVLTGVLIGAYGPETGSGGPDFESLVESVSLVKDLDRVRISSIEMPQVSDRLIDLMKAERVVPHLHIPLQSGDDGVLRDMNRRYTGGDYLRLCERLFAEVPAFSLTSDVMVGFPTEDERRFERTLEVCRRAGYLKAHVFRFSPRWGTPADRWGDPVSDQEKVKRSQAVAAVAAQTGKEHVRRFLGQTVRVLAEARDPRTGLMKGHADNYIEVAFAAPDSVARSCVWVTLSEESDGTAFGELSSGAAPDESSLRLRVLAADR